MKQEQISIKNEPVTDQGDEALKESIAKLRSVTTERNLLREGKADLERRVNQFTKQLGEKLEEQARKIQDDFHVKLKDVNEKVEEAETKAQDSIQQQAKLQKQAKETQERTNKELADAKDKQHVAEKAVVEAKQQFEQQLKQVKALSKKRLDECDLLREGKAELERRLKQFTKQLGEKLEEQARLIHDDFRVKLKNANEKAEKAETKAEDSIQQQAKLQKQAKETQERTNKELADAKDKQYVAEKAVVEAKKQFEQQLKYDEALSKKRLEECRQQLQVRLCDCRKLLLVVLRFFLFAILLG